PHPRLRFNAGIRLPTRTLAWFVRCAPVASFVRWRNERGLGPRNVWKLVRPDTRRLAGRLRLQRTQDLFGGDRNLIDANADRVEYRVRHRGHDGQQRPLANLLGAEGTLRIRVLDEIREDLGHVEAGRALVLEDRREL